MISEELIERINSERFRDFARKFRLHTSGNKLEVLDRILEAVSNGTNDLNWTTLDTFIADEISHGRNRMLFISTISEQASIQLRRLDYVIERLRENNFPVENFNNIRTTDAPSELSLAYLNIVQNSGNQVKYIEMCFVQNILVEGLVNSEGDDLPPTFENDFFWVEIDLKTNKVIVKLRPRGGGFSEMPKAKARYDEIYHKVAEVLAFPPRVMGDAKNLLYTIFRDLTQTAERPFLDQVLPLASDINDCASEFAHKLNLNSAQDPVDLPKRVTRLLVRALIQKDFKLYQSYGEGKIGVIDRFAFSDQTGAWVNARSGDRDGIEMADIYFDTKDTIDSIKGLDRLWVNWFYPRANEEPEKWETRIEVSSYYYVVHFLYKYLTREVEEFVLSQIRQFESAQY